MEIATLAAGCFWCTEAVFKRLKGVLKVTSGYAGGSNEKPTYAEVSEGHTGFAESIQIEFDPNIISFEKILEVFWATHDPTTLNQQGNDIGTQYRSSIFYHDEKQKEIAKSIKHQMEASGEYPQIVTEIVPFENFYTAEEYHQNYYDQNKNNNNYCRIVIDPKIQKLLDKFNSEVKDEFKN